MTKTRSKLFPPLMVTATCSLVAASDDKGHSACPPKRPANMTRQALNMSQLQLHPRPLISSKLLLAPAVPLAALLEARSLLRAASTLCFMATAQGAARQGHPHSICSLLPGGDAGRHTGSHDKAWGGHEKPGSGGRQGSRRLGAQPALCL